MIMLYRCSFVVALIVKAASSSSVSDASIVSKSSENPRTPTPTPSTGGGTFCSFCMYRFTEHVNLRMFVTETKKRRRIESSSSPKQRKEAKKIAKLNAKASVGSLGGTRLFLRNGVLYWFVYSSSFCFRTFGCTDGAGPQGARNHSGFQGEISNSTKILPGIRLLL